MEMEAPFDGLLASSISLCGSFERGSWTSRYHGNKIPAPQQFFLTESAICIVKLWENSMGYRFVCSKSNMSFFSFISATLAEPRFVEIPNFCYHGDMTQRLVLSTGQFQVARDTQHHRANLDQPCSQSSLLLVPRSASGN